ncbi:MAG: hypothetical protein N2D54_04120, partial [Chloroflexota bacterium]
MNILIIPPLVGLFTGVVIGTLLAAGPSFTVTTAGAQNLGYGLATGPGLAGGAEEIPTDLELSRAKDFDGDGLILNSI